MSGYQQGVPIEIVDTFTVDGVETDPTTVVYSILAPDGTLATYTWPGAVEISHPSTGDFVLSLSPPADPGTYYYDVDATGAVVASRASSFTVFANVSTPQELAWATYGPCSSWADSQDVWNCCGQPMETIGEGSMATECPVDMSIYATEASQILWDLSGRQFAGVCEKTARPCRQSCSCGWQVLSRGHVIWNNPLGSWDCGGTPCGCRALSTVRLSGYPVREIIEVKIDGDVVDPTEYALYERRFLIRRNNGLWPGCQDLSLEDTEDGTFSVTYRYGQDPPALGVSAAAQLGCELYRGCNGQDCALPTGTTRVTRQGIEIERAFFQRNPETGMWGTGMAIVDAFLNTINPHGLKRRPTFWAPGTRYARGVGA